MARNILAKKMPYTHLAKSEETVGRREDRRSVCGHRGPIVDAVGKAITCPECWSDYKRQHPGQDWREAHRQRRVAGREPKSARLERLQRALGLRKEPL